MAEHARDQYERYYAEKLWEMIPPIYRELDGLAENPGVLRAFVEIVAEKAALLRRSNDRLWDDAFIELCADWAVPYIGDLVGTRLVSALNRRGRRVDVAKTIYYRRRKGTPRVLEELISDITGWEGKLVEEFQRLARARHGLDPRPTPLAGRFTGTPPGGIADLRQPRGTELTDSPFDEFFHTPDVRRHRGSVGRYNIPKLGFHLYRIPARPLVRITPRVGPDTQSFTVDPSGRDAPLFMRRARSDDWEQWRSAREWELPAPMRCRVLGHAEYRLTEALILQLIATAALPPAAASDLRTFRGVRFISEQRLREAVATLASAAVILNPVIFQPLLAGALLPDCGKFALIPDSFLAETAPGTPLAREVITAGNLANWAANPPGFQLVVDPERGRLRFPGGAPPATLTVSVWYGFSAPLGAGTYDRHASLPPAAPPFIAGGGAIPAAALPPNAVTQIEDSANYGPLANVGGIQDFTLQAANQQRPYLRLTADWNLTTPANQRATLVLDGLWIGADGAFSVVLNGDYETVTIRRCTLDPGGVDAQSNPISPVDLVIAGTVTTLTIESSLLASIRLQGAGLVETLQVQDSILQALGPGNVIALPASRVSLARVTLFGPIDCDRLYATEALITGLADVTDTQDGCFRFSAALNGSRVPHPYQSHFLAETGPLFTSRDFGQPGYAQLSEAAPLALQRGAENGSEIGAFSSLMNPIKLDSLNAKVEEFAPFGLIPICVFET